MRSGARKTSRTVTPLLDMFWDLRLHTTAVDLSVTAATSVLFPEFVG